MKYGIAPVIKQAFEEVYKAPFIVRILVAELGQKPEKDALLTINYDGTFEETTGRAVLAATTAVQRRCWPISRSNSLPRFIGAGVGSGLARLGDRLLAQQQDEADQQAEATPPASGAAHRLPPSQAVMLDRTCGLAGERTIECAVLERQAPGTSKYRAA